MIKKVFYKLYGNRRIKNNKFWLIDELNRNKRKK